MLLLTMWLVQAAATLSPSLTLTTDTTITIFNGTTNPDFTLKEDSYDCSAYLYAYEQTKIQYQSNSPSTVGLTNMGMPNVSVSSYYGHFKPTTGSLSCLGQKCTVPIYHNCPSKLSSNNYFDIVRLNVQNLGSFYYYLNCNQEYDPIYFEWGQILITICATIILVFTTLTARLESYNGSGI